MQTLHFQKKFEALQEQVEVVRLEYDLCENKKRRHELLELLESLESDLVSAKKMRELGSISESWVGRLVTRGGDRVYKVRCVGQSTSQFKRMEFLFDPCGWKETQEITTLSNSFIWRLLTPEEIISGLQEGCKIQDQWIGSSVRFSNGDLYRVLSKEENGYLCRIIVKGDKFLERGENVVVPFDVAGWYKIL